MTRAEKKEELIGLFSTGAIYLGDLIDECFEFGQHRWISVEDGLPKEDGIYLFYDEASGVYTSAYYVGFAISGSITRWMPLPSTEENKGNQGEISPNKKGGQAND